MRLEKIGMLAEDIMQAEGEQVTEDVGINCRLHLLVHHNSGLEFNVLWQMSAMLTLLHS